MAILLREVTEERRKQITNKMIATPLSFPYADLESLRKITPLENRYNAGMNVMTEEQLETIGLDRDHIPELLLCRWQAAKYVTFALEEKGISFARAAEKCHVDMSCFSKYKKGDRPLAVEAPAYVPLCLSVLGKSCHEVMFGEAGKIIIPGIYSLAVRIFLQMPPEKRDELLKLSDSAKEWFQFTHPAVNGSILHRDPDEVIRERLGLLADAWGRNSENFFGEPQPRYIRSGAKAYFENNELYKPRMAFTVFLAFETGYALDYFISEDFTKHVPCFYEALDSYVELKDQNALRFMGNLFAVDHETRKPLMAYALSFAMQNG